MERAELASRIAGRQHSPQQTKVSLTVISESDPRRFMSAFAASAGGRGPVFLADPAWGAREVAMLRRLESVSEEGSTTAMDRGWLCVPTGGTGGEMRLARHDSWTLAAAARGFSAHFRCSRVNAVGLLPLHHVGGLMSWMRCALSGGEYLPWSWDDLTAGRFPEVVGEDWFLSLVPTQLQRLLRQDSAIKWLRGFRVVLVSGGPVWPALADAVSRARVPVCLCFGMTETAAMVTAQLPEEFPAGDRSSGRALPHARIQVDVEGIVAVTGESIFRGYWPDERKPGPLVTSDLGRLDEAGRLTILARRDAVIITGGRKVHPAEVEATLRSTGEFSEVAVVGLPHEDWGEEVVACYSRDGGPPNLERVGQALSVLASFKRPKRFVALDEWPGNAMGKVSRVALRQAVVERKESRR